MATRAAILALVSTFPDKSCPVCKTQVTCEKRLGLMSENDLTSPDAIIYECYASADWIDGTQTPHWRSILPSRLPRLQTVILKYWLGAEIEKSFGWKPGAVTQWLPKLCACGELQDHQSPCAKVADG